MNILSTCYTANPSLAVGIRQSPRWQRPFIRSAVIVGWFAGRALVRIGYYRERIARHSWVRALHTCYELGRERARQEDSAVVPLGADGPACPIDPTVN